MPSCVASLHLSLEAECLSRQLSHQDPCNETLRALRAGLVGAEVPGLSPQADLHPVTTSKVAKALNNAVSIVDVVLIPRSPTHLLKISEVSTCSNFAAPGLCLAPKQVVPQAVQTQRSLAAAWQALEHRVDALLFPGKRTQL